MNFIKKLKLLSKAVQREDQKINSLFYNFQIPEAYLYKKLLEEKLLICNNFASETGYKFKSRAEIEFLIMIIRVNKIRGSAMARIGRRAKKENKHIPINRISLYLNVKKPHKIPFVEN